MRKIFLTSLLVFFTSPLFAAAPVSHFTLDNGLTILVKPVHRAPVVVVQLWYKVGSADELPGHTGLSHMLEHMLFKGTAKHPGNSYATLIADNGGVSNAFTSRDATGYYAKLPKDKLALALELEADRMRNIQFEAAEFAKEHQVVIEERRLRVEDNPKAYTYERLSAGAHVNSPYQHPIIGWQKDLDRLTLASAKDWYDKWYHPNNATLVVVGDVTPQAVLALAKKTLGTLPKKTLPSRLPAKPIPDYQARQLTFKRPAQQPYLLLGFNVPNLKTAKATWQPYALEVLAGALADGDSARLPMSLQRKQRLVHEINIGYNFASRFAPLFLIEAIPNNQSAEKITQAIWQQLRQIKQKGIRPDEITKAKRQLIATRIFAQDSLFYQAMLLGAAEMAGADYQTVADYRKRIEAVTPQQVQTVAKQFLTKARLTSAYMQPLKTS